ncbi:hypothetical protein C0J52_21537 [Blattella germanica]|nr:hypothetical protein C0J52_21537 [Blattella germanica]
MNVAFIIVFLGYYAINRRLLLARIAQSFRPLLNLLLLAPSHLAIGSSEDRFANVGVKCDYPVTLVRLLINNTRFSATTPKSSSFIADYKLFKIFSSSLLEKTAENGGRKLRLLHIRSSYNFAFIIKIVYVLQLFSSCLAIVFQFSKKIDHACPSMALLIPFFQVSGKDGVYV